VHRSLRCNPFVERLHHLPLSSIFFMFEKPLPFGYGILFMRLLSLRNLFRNGVWFLCPSSNSPMLRDPSSIVVFLSWPQKTSSSPRVFEPPLLVWFDDALCPTLPSHTASTESDTLIVYGRSLRSPPSTCASFGGESDTSFLIGLVSISLNLRFVPSFPRAP